MDTEVIVAIASLVWAFVLLMVQLFVARGGGRKDFSTKEGNPKAAVVYNFTVAMMPTHKETVRNHPIKFVIGITMHMGAFYSILRVFSLLFFPDMVFVYPYLLASALTIPVLCGIYLFLRRIFSANMRSMSCFDDYLAILMTTGFTICAILLEISIISPNVFLIAASVLFFYLPIGKLRHVLFFFLARINYGSRLGYRGIYPASKKD